ncbi:MarR family winged helix-turn-helix transcriptional regulator [Aquincola tertiaricarbonis]|uniref:MarR family winged helix-turn-helix transcriptional regulator n=1 Tax=Aquincola tertiaricarbonis TaxID=391953 RepID=UPI0006151BCF|nr:MarR family transcriptional regulator [Aquincola tertiaricarbonis]
MVKPAEPAAAPALENAATLAADFYRADAWVPEDSLGMLFKRVMQSIALQADRRLAEHGLTHVQWVALMKLKTGHGCTVAGLARDLQTDAGAMTRSLDRLEAKGMVARVRSATDRRVVNLALTEEGERLAALVVPVLAEVFNNHLAGFSPDEWQLLLSLLRRMVRNGDALREADGGDAAA